jgi:hypothetical protein
MAPDIHRPPACRCLRRVEVPVPLHNQRNRVLHSLPRHLFAVDLEHTSAAASNAAHVVEGDSGLLFWRQGTFCSPRKPARNSQDYECTLPKLGTDYARTGVMRGWKELCAAISRIVIAPRRNISLAPSWRRTFTTHYLPWGLVQGIFFFHRYIPPGPCNSQGVS